MSNAALTWAFQQQDMPSGAKFVLVTLADFADDQWSCFPSQDLLARMTCLTERSVRSNLKWLEDHELITRQHRQRENGSRTTDRYVINHQPEVSAGPIQPEVSAVQPEVFAGQPEEIGGTITLTRTPTMNPHLGDSVATLPIDVEAEKPKRRRKSPEVPLPDDWKPTPKHAAFAREKNIDLPTEAMKFRNHAATHDRRCVRWDAAFDNWLIASLRYSPPLKVVPDDDDRPYVPYGTRPFVSRWG